MNISPTILLPLCSIGFGLLIISSVGYLYFSSRNMNEWRVTQGIITKSNIKRSGTTFSPDVQYQYSVLGTEHIGMNVTITPKQTFKLKVVQDWTVQYPVGKKVDVFYNPKTPRMAVLEKGFSLKSALVLIGAALLVIIYGSFSLLAS
jgi:hypothetical protein